MPDEADTMDEVASVADLRRQHVALLGEWRANKACDDRARSATRLREGAKALGKLLEDTSERDTAQSIIDYWSSAIGSLPGHSLDLTSLDGFDEDLVGQRATALDETLKREGPEAAIAEKILLRLLRVGQDDRIEEGPPVLLGEILGPAAGAAEARDALRQLTDAGILFVRSGATAEEGTVEVTSRAVARRSERVASLLTTRRELISVERLRATAQLWQQNDRASGYLLSGSSLDTASLFLTDHRDAENRTLNEFILASKAKAERDRSRLRRAIVFGPLLLAALVGAIGVLGYDFGDRIGFDKGLLEARETSSTPAPPRPVTTDQQLPASAEAIGPVGFVWIGSENTPQLRDVATGDGVAPDSIKPNQQLRVNGRANMNLREALPDDQNYSAKDIGIAPSKSLVIALDKPVARERPSGTQYWARVRVVPRVYIQYAHRESGALAESFRLNGFDVQPSERRDDFTSRPQVRFYHPDDAPLARALARAASDALRAQGRPAVISCRLFGGAKLPPPTVLEFWYNPGTVTHSSEARARAVEPAC